MKEIGFDGIEIPLVSSILADLPIQKMKERNFSVIFCSGLDSTQDVASSELRKRQNGIDHLKKCVDVVAQFGGTVLSGLLYGVWGGFSGFPPTEDELNHSADCLRKVADYALPMNISLAIEPVSRFEGYLIATAQEGIEYIRKVGRENIGLHLDTFQMNIEEENLPDAIRTVGDKLFHFHLCASNRGIPGKDHTDWDGVFGALDQVDYQGWITVESFSPDPGSAGSAAKVWRRLAPGPDEIARGGLNLIHRYYA